MTFPPGNLHALVVILPTWGHIRPGLALISKILRANSELIITCPIIAALRSDIQIELIKMLSNQSGALERVRLPCFGSIDAPVSIVSGKAMVEGFQSFYAEISAPMPYKDSVGQIIPAVLPPKVCLLDLFASNILGIIREINVVPNLAISFGSTAVLIRRFCPAKYSGLGDVIENIEELPKAADTPIDEILFDAYNRDEGKVIHIPGLPPMFDYEFTPESSPYLKRAYLSLMLRRYYRTFQSCDGLVLTSNCVYESEPIRFLREFLAQTNRPCYILGLDGTISPTRAVQEQSSPANAAITKFLDKVLEQHGRESLIYVSFGSVFWPTNVEASWKILEIIVEQNIPMILSYNEKRVAMPERVRILLESSERVVVTPWAPQKMILNHQSTGWFLTHCGLNSVIESLSHGVPIIAWPIVTDQPVNAAHITLNLQVAYELLEVRTSRGLKPLYRGAKPIGTIEAIEQEFRMVLSNAFGEDGKTKRRNAEILKVKLNQLWSADGESTCELGRFMRDYLS